MNIYGFQYDLDLDTDIIRVLYAVTLFHCCRKGHRFCPVEECLKKNQPNFNLFGSHPATGR